MNKAQVAEAERLEAAKELRKILQGQSVIRTVTEWTGSTAYVRLFIIKNNQLIDITHRAGEAMGDKTVHAVGKPYGLKYGGYGYSKPFQAVYSLGYALYPKGYKHTLKNCHSNDHSNGETRDWHTDGGYRFQQVEV